jgi:F-type H+-transporting ATPase subunit b
MVAQLVNFLVLIWLLKRFLFKPILQAIDEREKHITMQLQEAEATKENANKELDDFRRKNSDFDRQHQELLNNVLSEANAESQKLMAQVRNDVETLRLRLRETLRAEQQSLSSDIINRTRTEVFAIARKALTDLASINLEDQMADVFILRIKELKPEEKELFLSALADGLVKVLVRSTFEISLTKQDAIKRAIKSIVDVDADCKFEVAPDLVSGIELIASGYKISWTIGDYLVSLETNIAELLKEKSEMFLENNT